MDNNSYYVQALYVWYGFLHNKRLYLKEIYVFDFYLFICLLIYLLFIGTVFDYAVISLDYVAHIVSNKF
jgi:hypothetical protein